MDERRKEMHFIRRRRCSFNCYLEFIILSLLFTQKRQSRGNNSSVGKEAKENEKMMRKIKKMRREREREREGGLHEKKKFNHKE